MKLLLSAVTLVTLFFAPGVTQATGLAITSPQEGADVGRTVILEGKAAPRAALGITIDGIAYLAPADRSAVGHPAGPGQADGNGAFRITLDLRGANVLQDTNNQPRAVSAGRHTISLQEFYYDGQTGTPGSASVSVTVHEDEAAPTASPTPGLVAGSSARTSSTPAIIVGVGSLLSLALVVVVYRLSRS